MSFDEIGYASFIKFVIRICGFGICPKALRKKKQRFFLLLEFKISATKMSQIAFEIPKSNFHHKSSTQEKNSI